MAAFSVGAILLYCKGTLLPWSAYFLFIPAFIVFLKPRYFVIAACLGLGYYSAYYSALTHQESILPKQFETKKLTVVVYLCSIPRKTDQYSNAEFCVIDIFNEEGSFSSEHNRKIKLSWPSKITPDFSEFPMTFTTALKRPHGTLNPIGMSYEKYLFYRHVSATGTILEVRLSQNELPSIKTSKERTALKMSLIQRVYADFILLRLKTSNFLNDHLSGLDHAGILRALLVGERSDIAKKDSDILKNTGTQHLMAISGLHVGVIMLVLYKAFPRRRWALIVISLVLAFYVSLVGFSSSAQRAYVMGVIGVSYMSGAFPASKWRPYCLALFIVLLLDPLATLSLGFWLSFFCVAVLLIVSDFMPLRRPIWWFASIQVVMMLSMIPINAYIGAPYGLSALFANAIAIPLVSIVVLPGALFSFVLSFVCSELGVWGFWVLNETIHLLMTYLSSLNGVFGGLRISGEWLSYLVFSLGLFCFVVFSRFRMVTVLLSCVLIVCLVVPARETKLADEFIVFDVGQGLAISVTSGGQTWLYDTGPASEKNSIAESVILPYLRSFEVQRIEGIVNSHGDWDHAAGLPVLFSTLSPYQLWVGEPERIPHFDVKESCIEGMSWQSDTLKLDVLYPLSSTPPVKYSSNSRSCVVRVSTPNLSFLLMGDIEGEAEFELIKKYGKHLKADVLIAGHHGAKNATSYALLKHVQPKLVVFSAGYLSRFGHPNHEVLQRIKNMGIASKNTALDGALMFNLDDPGANGLPLKAQRNGKSPFWVTQ